LGNVGGRPQAGAELGHVAGCPPHDAAFKLELDAELARMQLFLRR